MIIHDTSRIQLEIGRILAGVCDMVRPSAAAAEKFMRSVVTPPLLDIMYDFCWSALPVLPLRPVIQRRECVREMKEEKALIERDDDTDVVARRRPSHSSSSPPPPSHLFLPLRRFFFRLFLAFLSPPLALTPTVTFSTAFRLSPVASPTPPPPPTRLER